MSERITDSSYDLLLLQYQDIVPMIEHLEQLKAIIASKRRDNVVDAYLLGFMHGKRAERAKKAKRAEESEV